jgi:serine/threonine protein kinase
MPERLGPYLLEKRIGAGGMADVFLARGPQGICVVKRPHKQLSANPEFVRMFLDEASILAQLNHPGIARIYDLGQFNKVYYLAMEYVPGFDLMTMSLEHERQGELMAPELCARIVSDAAIALHHAHEAQSTTGLPLNIIHRDVTPHNILLSMSGIVKLIDFGVARASTAMHRTQTGLVKGKYPYMSPEQITGQAIDRRVDVYALGLVLYELLTNVRAIAGETEIDQIDNARYARIRPIEQIRPNVPEQLRRVIAGCLSPTVERRYPTAQLVHAALVEYLHTERHVVGQEDLLRLFRVVAAEVSHLEPPTDPRIEGSAVDEPMGRKTELESMGPMASVVLATTEYSMTAPNVSVPSTSHRPLPMPIQLQELSTNHGSPQGAPAPAGVATAPPLARSFKLQALVGTLVVAAVAGVGLVAWRERPVVVAVPDASLPEVPVMEPLPDLPVVNTVEDAGQGAVEVPLGAEAVHLAVESSVAGLLSIDGNLVKSRFVNLLPGKHTVLLVNSKEGLFYKKVISVAPAERGPLRVEPQKGRLRLDIQPFGRVVVDRQEVSPGISYKEIELWEGIHTLEVTLEKQQVTRRVVITPGEETKENIRFELE